MQIDQAAELYQQGWSLARIGSHLGVDGTTVWKELRRLGVHMRGRHEELSRRKIK
jgi:IS30 family transposase